MHSFDQPMRQSYAAILIIMYRFYRILLRQLLPVFAILLIQGSLFKFNWVFFIVIPFAGLGAIYSIIAFFRFTFHINGDKLIVNKGVFKRTDLEIPLERVQSVNFQQNIIHRLFNVVKLEMDTAGSSKNEMELYALDHDKAQALSKIILAHKKTGSLSQSEEVEFQAGREVIFKLSLGQLFKVGITENHIRSGGVIIFFFFWIYDSLRDVGMDLMENMEDYAPAAEALMQSALIVAILAVLFVIVSLVISMVRTVLRYYDLHMYRLEDGFVVKSGLISRKEYAAKDHKIQLLKWSQNLLQKWAGIFELVLRQASSVTVTDKKALKVVGLAQGDIALSQSYVFRKDIKELENIKYKGVNRYYFIRRIFYWSYALIPLIVVSILVKRIDILLLLILIYAFGIYSSFLKYRKKAYGLGKELIAVNGGIFGEAKAILSIFKLQGVTLKSTPFQKRRKLSSVVLHGASGAVIIPDIETKEALDIKNYILYKIEKSAKTWM